MMYCVDCYQPHSKADGLCPDCAALVAELGWNPTERVGSFHIAIDDPDDYKRAVAALADPAISEDTKAVLRRCIEVSDQRKQQSG